MWSRRAGLRGPCLAMLRRCQKAPGTEAWHVALTNLLLSHHLDHLIAVPNGAGAASARRFLIYARVPFLIARYGCWPVRVQVMAVVVAMASSYVAIDN